MFCPSLAGEPIAGSLPQDAVTALFLPTTHSFVAF
jgi:hypothetical protein